MTSHQSSEDLLQPGHIVKVSIIIIVIINSIIIVDVLIVIIMVMMIRSDGK